jgi:hypothetical protein
MKRYKFSYPKIANRIIEWGIIFLIVFTPIAFGTVHPWAYTIMELTVCFLVIIWIVRLALININKTTTFPNLQSSTGSNRHGQYSNLPEPKGAGQQLSKADITPNSELRDLRSAKHTSSGRTPNSDVRRSTVLVNRFGFIKTPLTIPIIIFVGLILFQLTPLPPGVLKILSPNTYELYKTTLPDWQEDSQSTTSPNQKGRVDHLSEPEGAEQSLTNDSKSLPDKVVQADKIPGQYSVEHTLLGPNPSIPQSLNPSIPQSPIANLPEPAGAGRPSSLVSHPSSSPSWRSISVYKHATRTELYKILAYIGIFFLIVNYNPSTRNRQPITKEHRLRIKVLITRFIIAMVAVGCFESIYGLLECLGGYKPILLMKNIFNSKTVNYVTGTYVNRNHFAGYLAIVTCISVGYLTYISTNISNSNITGWRQKLVRTINIMGSKSGILFFLILIMFSALILSGSRMGIFSIITVIIFMSIMISNNTSTQRGVKFIKKIYFILIPVCLMTLWLGLEPVFKRFTLFSETMKATRDVGRIQVWKDTSSLIKDFPTFGTGLGTFEYAFPKYKTFRRKVLYDHAHNDYVELMSDTGFTGLIIVIAGAAYYLFIVIRMWFRRKNSFVRGITVGCLGGIAYIIIHSLTDFNLHIPANALYLTIITGIMHKTITQL